MKRFSVNISAFLLLSAAALPFLSGSSACAQGLNFGVNLSGGKEPVKIDADNMEVHDKEGTAVLTGNVSVEQGDRLLRGGKMIVYYSKADKAQPSGKAAAKMRAGEAGSSGAKRKKTKAQPGGLGTTGIDKLEISDKVYIKNGTQIAVGDNGVFNAKTNIMVLTGPKIVLTDGENVATGCKLTAHMDTGRAFLESCSSSRRQGRVSVIVNRDRQK